MSDSFTGGFICDIIHHVYLLEQNGVYGVFDLNIFVPSALFPDVVNCMQTDNLELKKLVYLYLMNYAKSQPDMAIMAVNTFVKVRFRDISETA